ncbi:MAG: hypothetical protein U1F65_08045 [Verrucomicrobiota bacterium]
MKLLKTLKYLAMAAIVGALTAGAQAQTVNIIQVPGYHEADGEFNVEPVQGSGYSAQVLVGGGYETFCISRDAGITIPGTYFASLNPAGVYQPNNVAISKGSAWLYDQFTSGTLPGYRYGGAAIVDPGHTLSQRAEDAYLLQFAFWTLEGQYSILNDPNQDLNNPWVALAANQFGGGLAGLAAAKAANNPGDYNVGVLNLNFINNDGSVGPSVQPVLARVACTAPTATVSAPISVNAGAAGNSASVPDAGAGATYSWTISNGSITDGQGTTNITWTAGNPGSTVISISITNVGGCNATGSHTVTVSCVAPDATITVPVSIYAGSSNNVASVPNAGAGATYNWSISNGSITGGQGTESITWTAGASGTAFLNVTVTKADGCDAQGMKAVTLQCVAPTVVVTAPVSVSLGSTNTASVNAASGAAVYTWNVINGSIVSGQGTTNIQWKPAGSGTTTLEVTVTVVGGCSAKGSKTVVVECVAPKICLSISACYISVGSTNRASVTDAGVGATYEWTVSNGTILEGQGTTSIKWKANAAGSTTLSVKVTTPGGCSSTACKTLCVICVAPNANISAAKSVNAGSTNTASVANAGAGATYVWTISNGTIISGQGTPVITWIAGNNCSVSLGVKVTNAGGCDDSDCASVKLNPGYSTYTIGGWGACPNGNNIASRLAKNFCAVYPSGLIVGGGYTIKLTSASAVQDYLPDGGAPAMLTRSHVNPSTTAAKTFGSQVVALKLNLDFSAKGLTRTGLGSLKVASGKLAGYTVTQVLTLANKVLGGNSSALPAGCSLTDLNNVLNAINNNYDNGTTDNGYLVP